MDSNTSKNTNLHKFFKLWFNYEKPAISLKNLLKQKLLSALNLNRQSLIQSSYELLDTTIDRQLILLSLERLRSLLVFDLPSIRLCYSCPIGLILAPRLQISPNQVVEDLGNLLVQHSSSTDTETSLPLYLNADPTGWLNFYVTEQAIAGWLERSLWLLKTQEDNSLLILGQTDRNQRSDLFCVQYIHARCCSLLRLGAREKLITLVNNDFDGAGWQLTQPASISWLDRQHHLWFNRSEYNLLRQLLIVTDSQIANDSDRWSKLALNLSQTTAIFLADCRFLGKIKEQYPERAIARLGLIALTQYWLQKILVEKLNSLAPTTL